MFLISNTLSPKANFMTSAFTSLSSNSNCSITFGVVKPFSPVDCSSTYRFGQVNKSVIETPKQLAIFSTSRDFQITVTFLHYRNLGLINTHSISQRSLFDTLLSHYLKYVIYYIHIYEVTHNIRTVTCEKQKFLFRFSQIFLHISQVYSIFAPVTINISCENIKYRTYIIM